MARRKDNPLEQAAKGFPGRRKKQVEAAIDDVVSSVEHAATHSNDPFPLPDLFVKQPAYWREAANLWKELAKALKATGRAKPAYRSALARYCIWTQLFMATSESLRKQLPRGGTTYTVKKGDGNDVIRVHPGFDFMAKAETQLRLIEAEFGFTPARDNAIMRDESFNAAQGRLPLPTPQPRHGQPQPEDDYPDPIGLMNDDDAIPAGTKPN